MPFGCPFFDPHLTTYSTNLGVHISIVVAGIRHAYLISACVHQGELRTVIANSPTVVRFV